MATITNSLNNIVSCRSYRNISFIALEDIKAVQRNSKNQKVILLVSRLTMWRCAAK